MDVTLLVAFAALVVPGAAFLAGVLVGKSIRDRKWREEQESGDVVRTNAELISHRSLLEELRKGPAPEMLEAVEFAVDCDVSALWPKVPRMHPSHRGLVLDTLRRVKQYREKCPRQIFPVPSRSPEILQSVQEAADGAREVLAFLDSGANESLQATAATRPS